MNLKRTQVVSGGDVLTFDRCSGRVEGAGALDRVSILALQAGSLFSEPFGHRGYSWGCWAVGLLPGRREIVVRLNEDAVFAFPFCDGYWSRLLNRRYHYEEEIEALLRYVAKDRYSFLDCGANFGYWSVLASSAPMGGQASLAIEASAANAELMRRNAELNENRFRCLTAAIGANGGFARVVGHRHEKFEVVPLAEREPDAVGCVSLDAVADAGYVDASLPVIVKLDVEGVEVDALKGAHKLLQRDCLVICEEHGSDRTHGVSHHLINEMALKLYAYHAESGRFVELQSIGALDRIKKHAWVGYNVFATASPFWTDRLDAATWKVR